MRARIVLAALGVMVAAGAGLWLVMPSTAPVASSAAPPASAPGSASGARPSASTSQTLASISVSPPSSTPAPTPTASGGGPVGGGDPEDLEIRVSLEMIGKEPTLDSDGMVDIWMHGSASARFPGPLDGPVTVLGVATIEPHPVDTAGCTWARTYATTDFSMTVLPPVAGSTGVSLTFEAPEWHYVVTCKGIVVTRMPAFGESQMLAFLGYAFPEYGPFHPGPLDVPPVSVSPDCIRRETTLQRSATLAEVMLHIVIYSPPCVLPLPPA